MPPSDPRTAGDPAARQGTIGTRRTSAPTHSPGLRLERADQPDLTIEVVEDQRDRLLAAFDVLWSGLLELLEQRRDELVQQEIAHLTRECDFAV